MTGKRSRRVMIKSDDDDDDDDGGGIDHGSFLFARVFCILYFPHGRWMLFFFKLFGTNVEISLGAKRSFAVFFQNQSKKFAKLPIFFFIALLACCPHPLARFPAHLPFYQNQPNTARLQSYTGWWWPPRFGQSWKKCLLFPFGTNIVMAQCRKCGRRIVSPRQKLKLPHGVQRNMTILRLCWLLLQ